MNGEKECKACGEKIDDLINTVYCFSCDALYCSNCLEKTLKSGSETWQCQICHKERSIDESKLFKAS
ncbi:hypothetical protein GF325_16805 [Candidatus Bathyarchaeota archaeon]|nr:hypothetical protein [Candidatus Bathyarchaeota archaeon]